MTSKKEVLEKVDELNEYENSLMSLKRAVNNENGAAVRDRINHIRLLGVYIGIPVEQIKEDIIAAKSGGKIREVHSNEYYAENFPEMERKKKKSSAPKRKTKKCKCK